MTSTSIFYLSAFIIISIELVLMMYILMLQPKQRSNQLFAVYMLTLTVSSYNILVVSTTSDVASIYSASRAHALTMLLSGPLLWLLLFSAFVPQHRLTRWLSGPLLLLVAVVLLLGVMDWLFGIGWFFGFDETLYSGVCVGHSGAKRPSRPHLVHALHLPV